VSYLLIQRLGLIRVEFDVAKASIDYLEYFWPRLHREPIFKALQLDQVRSAADHLEATYLVRLFSTFEAILRETLPTRSSLVTDQRSAHNLINRAASKWRLGAHIRDEVHRVREARNSAVHQNQSDELMLPFAEALAILNRFLSWLPDTP
jgi:hypothetical protein